MKVFHIFALQSAFAFYTRTFELQKLYNLKMLLKSLTHDAETAVMTSPSGIYSQKFQF